MVRISLKTVSYLSILVACLLVAVGLVSMRMDSAIRSSVTHKSAKLASATVVSVKPAQGSYTVCYRLDRLDQIEPRERARYESVERQRQATAGLRCRITVSPAAARLKAGDKLLVTYLLENEYRIDVVRVERCEELLGYDVRSAGETGRH